MSDFSGDRILVVNATRSYWSLCFAAEAALEYARRGSEVLWLDLPSRMGRIAESLHVNRSDRWKRLAYRDPSRTVIRILNGAGVREVHGKPDPSILDRRVYDELHFDSLSELSDWSVAKVPLGACVRASISGQIHRSDLDLDDPQIISRVRNQVFAAALTYVEVAACLDMFKPDTVVSTNDRLLTSGVSLATAAAFGQVRRQVAYWGGSFEKYAMFSNSLYLGQSWREQLDSWEEQHAADALTKDQQAGVLRDLKDTPDDIGTVDFRRKMVPGLVPPPTRRRRVTFFSGTPWEMSALAPAIEGQFANQMDVLRALLDVLDPDEWEVVLRHHPSHPSLGDVSESEKWRWTRSSRNVLHIDPDSPIDSLELAHASDLSVIWASTLGIRLLARGIPTIVSGPAQWTRPSWNVEAPNEAQLKARLAGALGQPDPGDVALRALAYRNFGMVRKFVDMAGSQSTVLDQGVFIPRPFVRTIRKWSGRRARQT